MSSIWPLNPNSKKRPQITVEQLYARNQKHIASHKPFPHYSEIAKSGDAASPILLLTCSDIRCAPERFFHLKLGEVVIIRCIGGRIDTQISGIIAADWMFNFREFVIVHHTDCGASHYTTEGLRALVERRAPGHGKIPDLSFGDSKEYVALPIQTYKRSCIIS